MSVVKIPESIGVKDFAVIINKSVSETIKILMDNGFLVTINEDLDFDTAAIIAEDLGFEVEKEAKKIDADKIESPFQLANILKEEFEKTPKNQLKTRPPIVTILGHVDHGKTTLLDTIRRTKVASGEAGGITQHITAYQVSIKGKTITFVDTPGHQAFEKMRVRGAGVADVAIVIIAADDGVKPQTKEVLESVKNAQIPFLVCLNKIDKPEANPDRVKGELAENGVLVEGWGGKVPIVQISAKNGDNIDELLETVLLVAEIEDLKASYESPAVGLVLESHLDKNRGPVATIIVKNGSLKKGDYVSAGNNMGKVRLMEDFLGQMIQSAEPGSPVTILGFSELPAAGSIIQVVNKDKTSDKFLRKTDIGKKKIPLRSSPLKRLEKSLEEGKYKKLNVLIKADTQGSLEALEQILNTLEIEDVVVKIIKSGVGQISESDVLFAKVSNSVLYGFRVSSTLTANEVQEKEGVKPRYFDVIYHLIEDVQEEMKKIITVKEVREDLGILKILAIFRSSKKEMIVGGKVIEGRIIKEAEIEVFREGEMIGKGKVSQLKEGQTDVEEAREGEECGILFTPVGSMTKIKEGDELKFYIIKIQ